MRYYYDDVDVSENGIGQGKSPAANEIKLAKIWIKMYLIPRKTINKGIGTSYRLKHMVENWARVMNDYGIKLYDAGEVIENQSYISNGAFISAMFELGYGYSCPKGWPNPEFAATYNGPYIIEVYGKKLPHDAHEWEDLLKPFLQAIEKD